MNENEKTGIPVEGEPDEIDVDEDISAFQKQEDSQQPEQDESVPMGPEGDVDGSLLADMMANSPIPAVNADNSDQDGDLALLEGDSAEIAEQEESDFLSSMQDEKDSAEMGVQEKATTGLKPEKPADGTDDAIKSPQQNENNARRREQMDMVRVRAQRRQYEFRTSREQQEKRREQNIKKAAVWSNLVFARNHKDIIRGEIIGCKVLPGSPELLAIILFGGFFRVMIPFSEIYADFPIRTNVDISTEVGVKDFLLRQRAMLEKMYGLETPLRVTKIETSADGGYVVLGSRAKAIKQMAFQNFEPDSAGNAVMRIGDIVPATVTTISEHTVMLNVGGIDTRIPTRNLTYRYLPNAYETAKYYHIGQEVPVMILDVVKNNAGNLTCLVSGTRAELEDAKDRHDLFCTEGEMTYGTISQVFRRKEGVGVVVIVHIDSYDIPALSGNVSPNALGRYPMPGDRVRVIYRDYNEETGMTYVGIRGNHGTLKP